MPYKYNINLYRIYNDHVYKQTTIEYDINLTKSDWYVHFNSKDIIIS